MEKIGKAMKKIGKKSQKLVNQKFLKKISKKTKKLQIYFTFKLISTTHSYSLFLNYFLILNLRSKFKNLVFSNILIFFVILIFSQDGQIYNRSNTATYGQQL